MAARNRCPRIACAGAPAGASRAPRRRARSRREEEGAEPVAREHEPELAAPGEVADPQHEVAARRSAGIAAASPREHLRLGLAAERERGRQRRCDDDRRRSPWPTQRHEEEQRQSGVCQSGWSLWARRCSRASRATTGASSAGAARARGSRCMRLVEDRAGRLRDVPEPGRSLRSLRLLEEGGRELDPQDDHVGHDAERDLEQHRAVVPLPEVSGSCQAFHGGRRRGRPRGRRACSPSALVRSAGRTSGWYWPRLRT